MNLYEINTTIAAFLAAATNSETGELPEAEEFWEDLRRLNLIRDTTIEDLLLEVKNLTAEATAIRAEANTLLERARALEKRSERIEGNVSYYLGGDSFKTNRVEVRWRKSTKVDIYDTAAFLAWAEDGHEMYVRRSDPAPDKEQIRGAMLHGVEVAGARLVTENRMNIK